MKKITIELEDTTFAWLEVLAVGLAKEQLNDGEYQQRISEMASGGGDNFEQGVAELVADFANSLSDGVKRSGSWERQCLNQLTGYDGTYVSGSFDESIKEDAKQRGFKVDNEQH